MLKAVILIGGPQKGTRFRPLSLDIPKPLFPVAGFPMVYHHIEACAKVPGMKEIILIGFYQPNDALSRFLGNVQQDFKLPIRYLQEYTPLGTAGGIYHFRDQILAGNPEYFFVLNSDVCCDFVLDSMLQFHKTRGNGAHFTIMATEAARQQALQYGCIVENKETHEVLHYVEKPSSYVSASINCGMYLFSPEIFEHIKDVFQKHQERNFNSNHTSLNKDRIMLEKEIFSPLAGTGLLFVYHTDRFWSQIKSAGAAIYANRHYLAIYHEKHPDRLAKNVEGRPKIIGDVFIHETATVHPTAVLGPNVTVGKNVNIGPGVRIRESMILEGATLKDHCCILHSIVGWNCIVGAWTRIEGTPNDPNPNKPFAKLETNPLFNHDGRLNPSITVIGSDVQIPSEVVVLNSIVLPNKDLLRSTKNQIIL
ncbi:mannose-1-phosphate guanyltransferase alpha-A-like isoform X2 [Lineus longissimus]|uniref:mannose-1-phosphate guanyltransferase alpha-A-like isoform X2 n=1 Tax=Lineus longissimus TaxID=88925 RepID=UPI002B4C5968